MTLMDTAQLLGNLGDFIGAIVIVITLIYLALQVRQNTNALHAQSRQGILAAAQADMFAIIENPDVALSLVKTGPLSPEENVKLGLWLTAILRVREFAWLQYRNGVIDEPQWGTERLVLQNVLRHPRSRAWWELVGRRVFGSEFVTFVDDLIRDQPVSNDLVELVTNWANR